MRRRGERERGSPIYNYVEMWVKMMLSGWLEMYPKYPSAELWVVEWWDFVELWLWSDISLRIYCFRFVLNMLFSNNAYWPIAHPGSVSSNFYSSLGYFCFACLFSTEISIFPSHNIVGNECDILPLPQFIVIFHGISTYLLTSMLSELGTRQYLLFFRFPFASKYLFFL